MNYISISVPSYPYFLHAGNALYRPGDKHQNRKDLSFFDMLVVERGTLYVSVESTEYVLHANDMLIIPPMAAHKGSRICTEETLFHWLHFNTNEPFEIVQMSESVNAITDDYASRVFLLQSQTLSEDIAQNVISIMSKLETSLINYFTHSKVHIKQEISLFNQQEIFLRLLHLMSLNLVPHGTADIANAAMQYISTHYMEDISLDALSKQLNCHPNHLIRCFKAKYQFPPNQMLIRIRLDRACSILLSSNNSITTVAYTVGFSSASYFCKQFKKIYRCSPCEYRKSRTVK